VQHERGAGSPAPSSFVLYTEREGGVELQGIQVNQGGTTVVMIVYWKPA
jgi:hypothetical protein